MYPCEVASVYPGNLMLRITDGQHSGQLFVGLGWHFFGKKTGERVDFAVMGGWRGTCGEIAINPNGPNQLVHDICLHGTVEQVNTCQRCGSFVRSHKRGK